MNKSIFYRTIYLYIFLLFFYLFITKRMVYLYRLVDCPCTGICLVCHGNDTIVRVLTNNTYSKVVPPPPLSMMRLLLFLLSFYGYTCHGRTIPPFVGKIVICYPYSSSNSYGRYTDRLPWQTIVSYTFLIVDGTDTHQGILVYP